MHKEAMEYIKTTGVTVFIDVQNADIVERLERMKVCFFYLLPFDAILCKAPWPCLSPIVYSNDPHP